MLIYKLSNEQYKEVKKLLEESPYDEKSLAKIGYTLREGKALNLDGAYYLMFKCNKEEEDYVKEKLAGKAELLEGEAFEKAKQAFEQEENNAMSGFGSLFG